MELSDADLKVRLQEIPKLDSKKRNNLKTKIQNLLKEEWTTFSEKGEVNFQGCKNAAHCSRLYQIVITIEKENGKETIYQENKEKLDNMSIEKELDITGKELKDFLEQFKYKTNINNINIHVLHSIRLSIKSLIKTTKEFKHIIWSNSILLVLKRYIQKNEQPQRKPDEAAKSFTKYISELNKFFTDTKIVEQKKKMQDQEYKSINNKLLDFFTSDENILTEDVIKNYLWNPDSEEYASRLLILQKLKNKIENWPKNKQEKNKSLVSKLIQYKTYDSLQNMSESLLYAEQSIQSESEYYEIDIDILEKKYAKYGIQISSFLWSYRNEIEWKLSKLPKLYKKKIAESVQKTLIHGLKEFKKWGQEYNPKDFENRPASYRWYLKDHLTKAFATINYKVLSTAKLSLQKNTTKFEALTLNDKNKYSKIFAEFDRMINSKILDNGDFDKPYTSIEWIDANTNNWNILDTEPSNSDHANKGLQLLKNMQIENKPPESKILNEKDIEAEKKASLAVIAVVAVALAAEWWAAMTGTPIWWAISVFIALWYNLADLFTKDDLALTIAREVWIAQQLWVPDDYIMPQWFIDNLFIMTWMFPWLSAYSKAKKIKKLANTHGISADDIAGLKNLQWKVFGNKFDEKVSEINQVHSLKEVTTETNIVRNNDWTIKSSTPLDYYTAKALYKSIDTVQKRYAATKKLLGHKLYPLQKNRLIEAHNYMSKRFNELFKLESQWKLTDTDEIKELQKIRTAKWRILMKKPTKEEIKAYKDVKEDEPVYSRTDSEALMNQGLAGIGDLLKLFSKAERRRKKILRNKMKLKIQHLWAIKWDIIQIRSPNSSNYLYIELKSDDIKNQTQQLMKYAPKNGTELWDITQIFPIISKKELQDINIFRRSQWLKVLDINNIYIISNHWKIKKDAIPLLKHFTREQIYSIINDLDSFLSNIKSFPNDYDNPYEYIVSIFKLSNPPKWDIESIEYLEKIFKSDFWIRIFNNASIWHINIEKQKPVDSNLLDLILENEEKVIKLTQESNEHNQKYSSTRLSHYDIALIMIHRPNGINAIIFKEVFSNK